MFAFKIWAKFASFKDPLGISQNITYQIPPKTSVSGMLACILGIEKYLEEDKFQEFEYSIINQNQIIKKTFSQNYINDYTKKVKKHINNIKKRNFMSFANGLRDSKSPQKPINRELLINPQYIIFIKNFKYEKEIIFNLKERISKFSFYLGNSEFAGNFLFLNICEFKKQHFEEVFIDSFVEDKNIENIIFNENNIYSPISFTTKLNKDRMPLELKNIIISNNQIQLKDIETYSITCKQKTYYCEFI